MTIRKYVEKYGIWRLMLRCFEKLKDSVLCWIYDAGSMEKYFSMKEKYDNERDTNKKNICFSHLGMNAAKYGRLVTNKAWDTEKENEKKILYEDIIQGKREFSDEYAREIEYCRSKGGCMLYPYPFTEKYLKAQTDIPVYIYNMGRNQLKYVMHQGKKLFFPNQDDNVIRHQYTQLIMEQDELSPHKYFSEGFQFPQGGIFVDVGSAEGIISLDVVECAEEIYLIERSKSWVTALESTFKEYRNKVHIINKYAGSSATNETVKLDDVLSKYKNENIFIKMDIEGMEIEALEGCVDTMSSNNCIFACAAYHTNTMEEKLQYFFKQHGYEAKASDGFMLFIYGKMTLQNGMYERMEYPYFRHGLIRAHR